MSAPVTASTLRTVLLSPLNRVIATCWPEVTKVFQMNQLKRLNWSNLIDEGLAAPIVAVRVAALDPTTELGPADGLNLRAKVTIHYVTWGEEELASFTADGDLFPSLIEVGLQFLQTLAGSDQALPFQLVHDTLGADASDAGEAMASMLKANMPIDAVMVYFDAILNLDIPDAALIDIPA